MVHSDVCGPMEIDYIGGKRYYVVFKDDFSKYRVVYYMKKKSEVYDKIKLFLAEMKNLGFTVKQLLTDNGTEYCNARVSELLGQHGIVHRTSMPYCPEQNGSAERENRTLVECDRTMIHAKDLPTKLWAEAVNTAAYIINRTGPTPSVGKTPYELFHGRRASINHIRVFGTECFVYVPKQKRKKWDKKSIKGYLVGYCSDYDGYRIWVPEIQDIIVSRDVTFKKEQLFSTVCSLPSSIEDLPNTELVIKTDMSQAELQEIETEEAGEIEEAIEAEEELNETNATEVQRAHENMESETGLSYDLRSRRGLKPPAKLQDYVLLAR